MKLVPLKQRPPLGLFRRGQLIPRGGRPRAPEPPDPPEPPAPVPEDET